MRWSSRPELPPDGPMNLPDHPSPILPPRQLLPNHHCHMSPTLSTAERLSLRNRCSVNFNDHPVVAPADEFAALARWCAQDNVEADKYGEGALINGFEKKVAALLGKPAAVFMPSGKMAQLIAARIHTERCGIDRIGMHATSHLELHEARAYAELLHLQGALIGTPDRPILADDLARTTDPLGCLLLELPMRECGGVLPTWAQLQAVTASARARGIPLQLDGARLWECGPYFAPNTYADIAALFDSVYVSFYKGIGGVSGAMLLGDADFIASARTWLVRFGGQLPQQTAAVASAAMRFDDRLASMPRYVERAAGLARALSSIPGVTVHPALPPTNLMHVLFDCGAAALADARDALAQRDGLWAMGTPVALAGDRLAKIELYVGDNLLTIDDATVVSVWTAMLRQARAVNG